MNRMWRATLCLGILSCLLVFMGVPSWSQEPAELPLRIRETLPLPGEIDGVLHPIKCDARNWLYLRTGSSLNPLSNAVRRISTDGKVASVFQLEGSSDLDSVSSYQDFAVDPRSNVYLLAYKRTGKSDESAKQVILAFDSDAKYKRTIELNVLLNVGRLAAFSSGEFLVGGERVEKVDGELRGTGRPFTGIFDSDGRLITEFMLPQDVEGEASAGSDQSPPAQTGESKPALGGSEVAPSAESGPGPAVEPPLTRKDFLRTLSLGSAVAADDGNVYLMRATSNPTIYVIAPSGTVVRRFEVPAPSQHSAPISFQVAAGKIVVMFALADAPRKFKGHLFTIVNAYDGEILAHYTEPQDGHVSLACYTPNGFTFVGVKDGQFVLKRTGPY